MINGESIVTAYAQHASGPGWSNRPVWVILIDSNGKLRQECLQPEEQGQILPTMYEISDAVHNVMCSYADKALKNRAAKEAAK